MLILSKNFKLKTYDPTKIVFKSLLKIPSWAIQTICQYLFIRNIQAYMENYCRSYVLVMLTDSWKKALNNSFLLC